MVVAAQYAENQVIGGQAQQALEENVRHRLGLPERLKLSFRGGLEQSKIVAMMVG